MELWYLMFALIANSLIAEGAAGWPTFKLIQLEVAEEFNYPGARDEAAYLILLVVILGVFALLWFAGEQVGHLIYPI